MAYGLIYTVNFSDYVLQISKDGYTNAVTALTAGAPAVTHKWSEDDPLAPIRGSSLTAKLIGIRLSNFYSTSDKEFIGILYHGSNIIFSGYLVQDDCIEAVDDLVHEVELVFTDNLGLLKETSFEVALETNVFENHVVSLSTSGTSLTANVLLNVGDAFSILSGATVLTSGVIATVISSTSYTTTSALATLSGTYNLATAGVKTASKISLYAIIQMCLRTTGVTLPLTIYSGIKEDSHNSNNSFFEQTLIARESFLKGEREYEDCYTVLEKVMSRFGASIFPSSGQMDSHNEA